MRHADWTPLAEFELEEILLYIRVEAGRPETARRIGEAIYQVADEQALRKLPGQTHPAAPEGWLYCRYKRWLPFYQPHIEGIEVLRIVDAVRDLPALFSGIV